MEIGGQVWNLNEKSKAKNGISKCQSSRLFRFQEDYSTKVS